MSDPRQADDATRIWQQTTLATQISIRKTTPRKKDTTMSWDACVLWGETRRSFVNLFFGPFFCHSQWIAAICLHIQRILSTPSKLDADYPQIASLIFMRIEDRHNLYGDERWCGLHRARNTFWKSWIVYVCVGVCELFGAIREINIRPPAAICLGSRLMRARHKKNSRTNICSTKSNLYMVKGLLHINKRRFCKPLRHS